MKFIEINKNLKQKIENVYNLIGENSFLIKQAITNIKYATIKNFEEFNFQKIDAEKIKANELEAILSMLPVGNDYRMVVINNPNVDAVKFINKFKGDESLVLVCIGAEKLTVGEIVDCTKLDRIDINRYVLNYLAKYNLSIEESALDYLIDATNSDMSKIVSELAKLTSYATGEPSITLDMATNLTTGTSEYVIFMLTNAIDNKNLVQYQAILDQMAKTLSHSEIFMFMGRYFRRMFYISIDKNDEELSQILNIKPYAVKKSRQNITKNGVKYYVGLYQKYVDLDYKIKSGKISPYNALYEIIF